MEAVRPSRTAFGVAFRRATHQLHDSPPLILNDPVAVAILGPRTLPDLHAAKKDLDQPVNIALRAFLVARSRYAEDCVAQAVATGVRQYVLLGAGLDTFAHRNPHPGLRVFEVDHPATQAWKRELVAAAQLPPQPSLTYAPCDFESQSLPAELAAAGFDLAAPAFFAWLGVVPYLTLPAFRTTVSFLAARPPGSGLVFDYAQPRSELPFREQIARDLFAARVAKVGEPFQLYFTPTEIARELSAFFNLEDLGSGELNSLYFALRSDHLRLYGQSGRIVSAWL
jgi:methyltransferase (TIGR00027 family)